MNAKQVLSKIASILKFDDATPIQAKTSDDKILQSSNFDVNDDVFEVGADGVVTAAADGEYTITFTTPEGETSTQIIDVDGGKIAEISTPSEAADEAKGTPEEKAEEAMASLAGDDIASPAAPNATSQTPQDIPQTMDKLSARIDELEKKFMDMISEKETTEPKKAETGEVGENSSQMSAVKLAVEPDEEEELPKLDGAPIDDEPKPLNKFGKKISTPQSTFLSKLYK
jgi:hypothetical protein